MIAVIEDKGNGVLEVLYKGDDAEPYLIMNRETLEPLAEQGKLKVERVHPSTFEYTVLN